MIATPDPQELPTLHPTGNFVICAEFARSRNRKSADFDGNHRLLVTRLHHQFSVKKPVVATHFSFHIRSKRLTCHARRNTGPTYFTTHSHTLFTVAKCRAAIMLEPKRRQHAAKLLLTSTSTVTFASCKSSLDAKTPPKRSPNPQLEQVDNDFVFFTLMRTGLSNGGSGATTTILAAVFSH